MTTKPLVSIIIPTYMRNPELIDLSITSALKQTYTNIEIIIVDDSPSDSIERKRVEQYINSLNSNRIKYIKHHKNLGANVARNTGIKFSNGLYCAFLDDDDEWELKKIELQLKKILESKAALIYCKGRVLSEKGEIIKPLNNELHKGDIFNRLIWNNFIGGNSFVMIKKSVFDSIGFFNESMLSNQDWELYLRISRNYKIDYVDEFLVKYYVHSGERISSNPRKKLQGWEYLYNLYSDYLDDNSNVKNYWDLNMISIYLKNKQYKKFLFFIFKTFYYSPSSFISYFKKIYKIKTNQM